MDAVEHVRPGVRYPATLLTAGVHDSRVEAWQPAKMTAVLQERSTSGYPVLLRVGFDAGHGMGLTKQQRVEEMADCMPSSCGSSRERDRRRSPERLPGERTASVAQSKGAAHAACPPRFAPLPRSSYGSFPIATFISSGARSIRCRMAVRSDDPSSGESASISARCPSSHTCRGFFCSWAIHAASR